MKQIILYIDTTSNVVIKVGMEVDGKMDMRDESHEKKKAQIVLPMLEQLLRDHHLELHDLDAIRVELGPGSFTGVRVGVTIANTLGSILQIPINGKKIGELVEPVYS
jgi:tRNA threonylcarbamoyladenosine biosynthesis protein TsaB